MRCDFYAGAMLACLLAAPACLAASATIRIDKLGVAAGHAGHAFLVAPGNAAGAPFAVLDRAGHAAYRGTIGATTGAWAAFSVYRLDFPSLSPGAYRIAVAGAYPAQSGPFAIAAAGALYGGPIANALTFYRTERDGPDFFAGPLRTASAHLNDASATVYATPALGQGGRIAGKLMPTGETMDASGGWWDAGDYLKFVETESYTVGVLLTGLRDFPAEMGAGSGADFTAEAKFGLGWLLRMWDDRTRTLRYQVGIGTDFVGSTVLSDHDLWRLPQRDDTLGRGAPDYVYINHRPVFAAGPAATPVSPNLAGRLAASFALGYAQFRATDPAFAARCLLAAEHVFALADPKPMRLLTALPYGFYPEREWRDDLEWGATELFLVLATAGQAAPSGVPHADASFYLAQAEHWARAYIDGPNDAADTLNLYDVSGLAHFDLIRALDMNGAPSSQAVSRHDLLADLRRQLDGALAQAARDPFGFGFPWAAYDTTSHGAGLSVMAAEYAYLTGDPAWDAQSRAWMGNIMGENIWGLSLIVGDGTNFPHCLQHQVANLVGSLHGGTPVLAGAAVEGPNATGAVAHGVLSGMRACPADGRDRYRQFTGRGARFWDDQQNYANTEPAIDLTATSPLMFAWRVAGGPVVLRR